MMTVRIVSVILASVIGFGLVGAQVKDKEKEKEPDKPPVVKLRGQLPTYYKSLGLRDDQRQAILKIRADSKTKQDALRSKIETLKADEKADLEKVLSADQVKRLKELRSGDKAIK